MVNYNNETTLATPSNDINRIQILERRAYVIESLEQYYQYKNSGAGGNTSIFRSRVNSLFWELQETIKRKFEDYEQIKLKLFPEKGLTDLKEVIKIWDRINIMLGEINLTKIDTKKDYDSTNLEEENSIQRL